MITPPPGFELDQHGANSTGTIPPPPGFELDPPTGGFSQDVTRYFHDVAQNAGSEVTGMIESAPGLVKAGLDIASIPQDVLRYIGERVAGKPHEETTFMKDLSTVKNVVQSGPDATLQMAKDIGNTVIHPFDSFREKPIGTAGNAALLFGGAAGALEKAGPAVSGALESGANALGRRATGFTKALIKGQNFDKANNSVQWMLDKKILTPGADPETMLERVSAAKDEAFAQMTKTLQEQNYGARGALSPQAKPQLREQFLFDPNKAIDQLEALRPKAKNGKILKGGEYDAMNAVIDNAQATIKGHGPRPIPWDEANDLKGNLRANWDTTKSNAVNDLKKRVYGVFTDSLDTQLEDTANARGATAAPFMQAKRDYAHAKSAERALDNIRSSKTGNRQVSLTDTIAGVGGAAAHGMPGAAATIIAKKIIERFGLTAGATVAQKLSAIAAAAPRLLGPYSGVIKKAIAAGGSDVLLTHKLLAKSDPNYRVLIGNLLAQR